MLDPQKLRSDLQGVAEALSQRAYALDVEAWTALEEQRKELQLKMQDLQNQKNQQAKQIGQAKSRGEDIQPLLDQVKDLGDSLSQAEADFADVFAKQSAWVEKSTTV